MKRKLILLAAMAASITIAHAQWQLTGNSIASSDFLGSTNAQPLVFKVNNVRAGLLDYDNNLGNAAFGYQALLVNTAANNAAFGFQALAANTTGSFNTGIGRNALNANTSGAGNTAVGGITLTNNTTGSRNVAVGLSTLFWNTTGSFNVATGYLTLADNTIGEAHTAYGYQALRKNTTGTHNTAFGSEALFANTTTSNLTALGYQSMFNNTTGSSGVASGYQSLYSNTTGNNNTAHGYQALYSNTTGFENVAVGYQSLYANVGAEWNTAVGFSALYFNITGESNTAVGNRALYSNSGTSPHRNTAVGDGSLFSNVFGANNTGVGYWALFNNTSGSQNTALGYQADVSSGALTNATAIGNGATATASNMVRVGNASVTSIGGSANWTNFSDQRFKKNVKENVPGLSFINQLRPVTYTLDVTGIEKFLHPQPRKDYNGHVIEVPADVQAIAEKEKLVYTGFIAQEVESTAKKMGYEFSGVDAAKSDRELYGLRYAEFVVPLVKSVQELSRLNDSLVNMIGQLQDQVNELRMRIGGSGAFNKGFLKQNVPNPSSSGNTIIEYFVPETSTNAQLVLTDMSGKLLRQVTIGARGMGQLSVSVSTYPSGTYVYSLFVDGKKVDSRQMVLTK